MKLISWAEENWELNWIKERERFISVSFISSFIFSLIEFDSKNESANNNKNTINIYKPPSKSQILIFSFKSGRREDEKYKVVVLIKIIIFDYSTDNWLT